jgi:hypothetical protein
MSAFDKHLEANRHRMKRRPTMAPPGCGLGWLHGNWECDLQQNILLCPSCVEAA